MKTNTTKNRTAKKNTNHMLHIYGACATVVGVSAVWGCFVYSNQQAEIKREAALSAAMTNTIPPIQDAPNAYANVSLIGKAAIVYDLTTGQTLYAQNSNTALPLASITKLLTLYAASNTLSPSSTVTMTPTALSQANDAADVGFKPGESFTFEDIARLTLAASSNDGAEAIAEAADSVRTENTTSLLAGAAAAVGLTQTHATNGTGLDINTQVSGGYGSAHDIAVLAGALLQKDPSIAQATTLPSVTVTSLQGDTHTFANTDLDVTHIPDPLLSKTGYTDLAGGNLVVVYDAGINHPVAVVVLGSTEDGRFSDVQQLVNATLAHFAGTVPPATTTTPTT